MSRPLRLEYSGACYHVTARGNARKAIFRDEEDQKRFLVLCGEVAERFGWEILTYCLMTNHYHLVVRTPEANLARAMRHLNGVYTQRYNRRHRRVGHVFQGRYKAMVMEMEGYLTAVCAYVVLNPVRAKLSAKPEQWKWSSYRATLGLEPTPAWLAVDELLRCYGKSKAMARQRFAAEVQSRESEKAFSEVVHGQILIGSGAFAAQHQEWLEKRVEQKEIPLVQRQMLRPSLTKLFQNQTRGRGKWPADKIHEAYTKYGYKLAEIASALGVHYATISRVLRKYECKT